MPFDLQEVELCIGAESYARTDDGALVSVRLTAIALWLQPAMFLIRWFLPLAWRGRLATAAMQNGLTFEQF